MKLESSKTQTWPDYWAQDSFWSATEIWDLSANLFKKNIFPRLGISKHDTVLNIGSGTGSLEILLAPQVASILSIDSSARLTKVCAERTRHLGNVTCRTLEASPESLMNIRDSFSLFLCVSVIQYFRSTEEIADLLVSCSKMAEPGARILLGDLYIKKSFLMTCRDVFGSLISSIQNRYFVLFLKTTLNLLTEGRHYRAVRDRQGELCVTRQELDGMARDLGFHTEWIEEPGSVCHGRPSLLLHLPPQRKPLS